MHGKKVSAQTFVILSVLRLQKIEYMASIFSIKKRLNVGKILQSTYEKSFASEPTLKSAHVKYV